MIRRISFLVGTVALLVGSTLQAQTVFTSDIYKGSVGVANAQAYGVTCNGTIDDTAALQAAINAAEAGGIGAVLYMPHYTAGATCKITSTLTITKPFNWVVDGNYDDSSHANGSANPNNGVSLTWAGGASPMIRIISATAGNRLWGMKISGLVLNGGNTATYGIWASSVARSIFDVSVSRCVTAGMLLDDQNGALAMYNDIPRFYYVWGTHAATQNSHGLVIDGTAGYGVPQTFVGEVHGLTYNGDMIYIGNSDNDHIIHNQGGVQSGGTGHTMSFRNSGVYTARNNVVEYVAGRVLAESATYGNRIKEYNSEGAILTLNGGAQIIYDVVGYQSGDHWQVPPFPMEQNLTLPASALVLSASTPATRIDAAGLWPGAVEFPAGSITSAGLSLPDNELWHNGAITGIRLNYVIDNTAVGDVSLRVRVSNPYITGTSLTTVQADETFSTTMPATANTLWRASTGGGFTAIGIGYNQGLVLRIDRQGGTTADTATGNFIVTGITIIYSGYGPAPNGSIVNSPLFKP